MSNELIATLAAFGLNTFAWLVAAYLNANVKAELSRLRAWIAENYISKSDARTFLKGVHHV